MNIPPLALLPFRIVLWFAGFLVPAAKRPEWEDEWFAEIWHWWKVNSELHEPRDICSLYELTCGCCRDAWWYFTEDGEARERVFEWLRSPRFCLAIVGGALSVVVIATGFLPATRRILSPLPYPSQSRVAVISRTGRLQPVRAGLPFELAESWRKTSPLLEGLAMCSLPKRTKVSALGGSRQLISIAVSGNLFSVLGVDLPGKLRKAVLRPHTVLLSYSFWEREFHRNPAIAGQTLTVDGEELVIGGVLPERFWFLSPAISMFEVNSDALPASSMLVARCRPGVSPHDLEEEVFKTAENNGYEFSQTAPHAVFLRDAIQTPLWLFSAALFIAAVLVVLAHGSRWLRTNDRALIPPVKNRPWWVFFAAKTVLALLLILVTGLEIFVGGNQQTINEALGGPALIWFYIVGCNLVLFASISDQRARCRVCQRLLAFPIRIGCPGCLFLDWAGTEFLCPQGHGVLYVPHHVTCWEEADRWILLEV